MRANTTIKLPSNGKIYKTKELTLQNMTIAEEKFLYGSSDGDKAIDQILKNCIIDKDVNVEDLIVPDKYYALVQLRMLTYGDEYPIDLTCRGCGKNFTETVKLSTLEVDELPDDFKEPIKITLPVSGDVLELYLPRSNEISRYNELAERKADKFDLDLEEVNYIFQTMLGIKTVNGDQMLEDELYEYVKDLSGKDSSYIKHEFNKIKVGYYTRLSCDCPKCGRKVPYRLSMTSDFFLATFED